MVLKRQDNGKVGAGKRRVADLVEHVAKENVSAHGLAVRDYRLTLVLAGAIPAVQLNASKSSMFS